MRPDELISVLHTRGFLPATHFYENELFLEVVFWLLVALLTVVLLIFRPAIAQKIERVWTRLSRRKGLAVGITILSALAVRAALLPLLPIPDPVVHDEYSYLFQAKTFALGRLTNPTPAMWVHFETFHINMWPTYQSMYPPGQALFMAGALVLHLDPWWGAWLSVGLMCGAVCWMLQGWMPPQWAFLGGMFCVIRFATFSYFVNSYWGGATAAIGGALVMGALPRIKHSCKARHGLLFALGLAILANSRPYEGFVFSIPALASVGWWLLRSRQSWSARMRVLVPALALLAVVVAGMAYYNWRGTGHPLLMPYAVNQQQYHITKPFIWQTRNPIPKYRHQIMRTLYVIHELPDYLNRRYPDALWLIYRLRLQAYYDFYWFPMFGLVLFAGGTLLRSRRMRVVALSVVMLLAGLAIQEWPFNPHYAAPMLCSVIAIVLFALRFLRTWKIRSLPVGQMMVRSAIVIVALWTLVPTAAIAVNPENIGLFSPMPPTFDRSRLLAELERMPGQHLVIVHNRRSADGLFDWVFNEPDIDDAKVIWARDMGPANEELVRYYADRHIWIVDEDDKVMRLHPYDSQENELDPARILHVASNQMASPEP